METQTGPQIQDHVFLIEVNKIEPNPYQPRRFFDDGQLHELANSIRDYGILQPLVVSKIEEVTDSGTTVRYQLIAGERRFRAAQLVGLERVPAVIKNIGLDREKLELAIIENVQRANLNPIEAARAYSRLQDEFRLTQREIAQRIGKSREVVANTLRLLNLPQSIQLAVSSEKISESQARFILSLSEPRQQEALYEEIIRNNLSVREIRNRVINMKGGTSTSINYVDPEAVSIKERLEEMLGTAVQIQKEGSSGKITIEFSTPQELHSLLEKMTATKPLSTIAPVVAPQEDSDLTFTL